MKVNPLMIFGVVALLGALAASLLSNSKDPAGLLGIAGVFLLGLGLIKGVGGEK